MKTLVPLVPGFLLPPGVSEAAGGNISFRRGAAGTACQVLFFPTGSLSSSAELIMFLVSSVQLHDADGGLDELELQSPGSQPSILPNTDPFMDLELHWQDLLAIMEPQVAGRRD